MYNVEVEGAHEYIASGFVVHNCGQCLAYAGRWMPIVAMPPIGSLECMGRCHCHIQYRA